VAGLSGIQQIPSYGAPLIEEWRHDTRMRSGGCFVPERIGSGLAVLAVLAVLALIGCGGPATETAPTSAPPTPATTSAVPNSASPTPGTSASASPSSPSAQPASASPASTKDGTYAGELSLSEDGALSYVPLRWYTGSNAVARCREKGIKPELAWCTDYYYEKAGARQAAALTEQTEVELLNDDLKPVGATPAELVEAIENEVWPYFKIAVSDRKVVRITQVFTP
jgi:hypothetical protein